MTMHIKMLRDWRSQWDKGKIYPVDEKQGKIMLAQDDNGNKVCVEVGDPEQQAEEKPEPVKKTSGRTPSVKK